MFTLAIGEVNILGWKHLMTFTPSTRYCPVRHSPSFTIPQLSPTTGSSRFHWSLDKTAIIRTSFKSLQLQTSTNITSQIKFNAMLETSSNNWSLVSRTGRNPPFPYARSCREGGAGNNCLNLNFRQNFP